MSEPISMPRTKTDLLHHIQQGWAGLEQTISQLSAGRMSTRSQRSRTRDSEILVTSKSHAAVSALPLVMTSPFTSGEGAIHG
jgi:hypothetical protein